VSLAYLVTALDIPTRAPLYYFSGIQDAPWPSRRVRVGFKTPNGQVIMRVDAPGRRLYVYTRSRVYYLRRNKLRLWRLL